MFDRGSSAALLRPSSVSDDDAALELAVGDEVIAVRIDRFGLHFRHRAGSSTEGHLPWDVALALSLLPDSLRARLRAGPCRAG
jgi:hypothetical protein